MAGKEDVSDINANDDLAKISDLGVRGCENAVFEFEADPDLLYQEVDVIFREDTDDPGVLSRDSKVYAVLPTGNTYVYDTTMDAITIAPSNENKDAFYPTEAGYRWESDYDCRYQQRELQPHDHPVRGLQRQPRQGAG